MRVVFNEPVFFRSLEDEKQDYWVDRFAQKATIHPDGTLSTENSQGEKFTFPEGTWSGLQAW